MQCHCLGFVEREDEGCALAVLRANGAENIGRGRSLIARRRRPGAALRPTPRDLILLADAGLVAKPDFYRLAVCLLGDSRHNSREVFLKAATAAAPWA